MVHFVQLIAWSAAVFLGGYFIVKSVFHLNRTEQVIVGAAAGFTLETVLAAILCRVMPVPLGFYLSAGVVALVGIVLCWKEICYPDKEDLKAGVVLVPFILITGLMYAISRGMGIFDDFAHLPIVSLVAAGDIPPHFAYNRSVLYAYHYFIILAAGQIARVGDIFVWSAMDLARSLSFSFAVFLGGLWTARLTSNRYVGLLGGILIALGGGARWILLLFSPGFLEQLSPQVSLIGSGASSGYTLAEALLSEWRIEGVGKLPIPFAFTNGIVQPGVLSMHGANGTMNLALLLLLLLVFNRGKNWKSGLTFSVLLSGLSLVGEADLFLILAGWIVVLLAVMIRAKKIWLSVGLRHWGYIIGGSLLLSLLEGGAFTDILHQWVAPSAGSYQSVGFVPAWPPTIVSSQLGVLPLFNPNTLLAALLEIGPVILVIPLVICWGYKALRAQRWFETCLIAGFLLTLGSTLVNFEGSTGVRNTSRLYSFLLLCMIYFTPLLWNWVQRRADIWKYTGAGIYLIAVTGGFVLLAVQIPTIQKPIVTPFMSELDAKISQKYWNKLDQNAMVFDSNPSRSVIVFGRALEAGLTWYEYFPEWSSLRSDPDPVKIHKAGYDYVYVDEEYWNSENIPVQMYMQEACVVPLESEKMWPGIIRKLFDVTGCR